MLLTGYVYVTNLVYHLSFLFCADLWWDQLPRSASGFELSQCRQFFPAEIYLWQASSFWMLVFPNYFSQLIFFHGPCSCVWHTLMENGLRLLSFLWMGDLLHLFLPERQQILALLYLHCLLNHNWSPSGFLNKFLRRDL